MSMKKLQSIILLSLVVMQITSMYGMENRAQNALVHPIWYSRSSGGQQKDDILILQEVVGGQTNKWEVVKRELEQSGYYKAYACASTSQHGVYQDGILYNCIYSKYPFVDGKSIEKQYATNPDVSLKMYQG